MAREGGRRSRSQVGDAVLRERTGRDWDQWLHRLDAQGASSLDHRDIVALVATEVASPWYRQMIAVVYEQERGLRAVHEKPTGFEVGRSRTVTAPRAELHRAVADGRRRRRWLPGARWTVRSHRPGHRLRVAWEDGTMVEFRFLDRGQERSRLTVQHSRLADAAAAEHWKSFWSAALNRLKTDLEG